MSDGVEARLKMRDAGVLVALLVKRAGSDDDFRLWLATELAALDAQELRAPLDPEPFRRRADALLESARSTTRRRHWDDLGVNIDEAALEELLAQAEPFLGLGDGNNALAILKPVAASLAEYWPQCADWDETLHEFFPLLDAKIAQAVLLDGVSHEARDDLADELSHWQDEVSEHGAGDAFAVAIAAATQGWDEPGLEDVFDGRGRVWPLTGTSGWLDGQLTTARLAALAAMGRTEWFLNLSHAAGRFCEHAVMLAKRDRIDEALSIARANFRDPDNALRLAETLLDMNHPDEAFELADWGLSLPTEAERNGPAGINGKRALASWLREAAQTANRPDLAIKAAGAAFEESLAHEDYRTAQRLCPAQDWPDTRARLLKRLMDAPYAHDRIDILLDENRIDDAIATVDRKDERLHSPHDPSLMCLARAACAQHPDWTIRFALRMASPIMSEGRSGHYDLAVRWLELAARAHMETGTTAEWHDHLDTLIQTHRRKHKLRALLEAMPATVRP
ncbi:MAG: hypothetical protein Q8R44_05250 [Novosphingobium sp.]|nr:hypothetical protein [Novosphingobium sp.]